MTLAIAARATRQIGLGSRDLSLGRHTPGGLCTHVHTKVNCRLKSLQVGVEQSAQWPFPRSPGTTKEALAGMMADVTPELLDP